MNGPGDQAGLRFTQELSLSAAAKATAPRMDVRGVMPPGGQGEPARSRKSFVWRLGRAAPRDRGAAGVTASKD
jgi:hypothetical protein